MHSSRPRFAPTSLWLSLALILVLPAMSMPPGQGAEFPVDSSVDEVDADVTDGLCLSASGGCTLRAAVMQANDVPGHDTIRLPAGTVTTLTLQGTGEDGSQTGDLDILDDLAIVGGGLGVSGAEARELGDRALHVHPGVTLSLSGVSFFWANAGEGQDGGGLLNEGTVSLIETSFQFNRARSGGGVLNAGDLTMLRSLVGYNTAAQAGGGIFNNGTLTIEQSTIANNEVTSGLAGGILNHGPLAVRDSTIAQNRSTEGAGAVHNGADGSIAINSTTIYLNAVPQGSGPGTGGVFNEGPGTVRISNSAIASNVFGPAYDEADCYGPMASAGYNLLGSLVDCSLSGDTTGNLVGVDPLLPGLPTLDPAQTWGYPPLEGSPLIDAGNPADAGSSETACGVIDQRGNARPIGFRCDIGAYESEFGAVGTPSWTPTEVPTLPPSPTPEAATWTPTDTAAASATPSSTFTYTPIPVTPSFTPTGTVPTMTPSITRSKTPTLTRTPTRTPSRTLTATATATLTSTPSSTPFPSPSPTPMDTATPTASWSPPPTATATNTPNPTPGGAFSVTTWEDRTDANPGDGICAASSGECSLRAAVMEANAAGGISSIELPAGGFQLILQGTGEDGARTGDIDVFGNVYISGTGMTTTGIEATGLSDRAFHVHPGARLVLDRLSVFSANAGPGQDGGGLWNEAGEVILYQTSFQYNTGDRGGGLMNSGTMYVQSSLLFANTASALGGAVYNEGNLVLDRSTLAQNQAAYGGAAIANAGSLTIRNTTISSNIALDGPAALLNEAGASAEINNTTIYANFAQPGGLRPVGGIESTGTLGSVTLSNTILSSNANEFGQSNCYGSIDSAGYNLLGDLDGCLPFQARPGDLIGINNPMLGPLTANADGTGSHPPLPGSPAIDAGNPAPVGPPGCEPFDQRGVVRPQGPACDIGAYEVDVPGPTPTSTRTPTATRTPTNTRTPTITRTPTNTGTPTNTHTPSHTPTPSLTPTSSPTDGPSPTITPTRASPTTFHVPQDFPRIQAAVDAAIKGDVILVDPGTYYEIIDFRGKAVHLLSDEGPANTVIDGYGLGSVVSFITQEGAGSVLEGFTIRNGDGSFTGGGGVFVRDASPRIIGNTIEANTACNGLGIYSYFGSPYIAGNLIRNNVRSGCSGGTGGGGILLLGAGSAVVSGNTIAFNDIKGASGAGISLNGAGTPLIEGNTIRGNRGAPDGGGISLVNVSDALIVDNLIVDNAAGEGGGIYWAVVSGQRGPHVVSNTIVGNTASDGSAISANGFDAQALLQNNILIGDVYCGIFYDPSPPQVLFNDVFVPGGPAYTGACSDHTGLYGNLSIDPAFVDPSGGDYHLDEASPVIDAGDNNAPDLPLFDFDGDPRILDGNRDGIAVVDMGYDEFWSPSWPTITPAPTDTLSPTPTATETPTPTDTATPTSTDTPMPTPIFADGFETGDLTAWSSAQVDQGDLSVTTAAAIGGSYGLQAMLDDNRSIYVIDDSPSAETAYRARFYFDPNSISMASGNAHIVFLAWDDAGVVAFRIELRAFQGDFQVRGVAPLDSSPAYLTPWITVADGPHFLEASWWSATTEDAWDGGLHFFVDGGLLAGDDGLDNDGRQVDSLRLGAVSGVDSGTRGTYFFDLFASSQGAPIGPDPSVVLPPPTPLPDGIFADGFESGDLAAWSAVKGNGDLLVTSAAAMEGALGMEAVVNDTAALYVADWSPFQEPRYDARFVFDPSDLTMLDGRSHVIFQGLQGSSTVIVRIELRFKTGQYQIRAGALDENGWRNTAWAAISNQPHVIEVGWKASVGDHPEGALSLSVDGIELERQLIYSNWFQIDFIRLGAVAGVDAGTLGSMYFDAFESWRTTIP